MDLQKTADVWPMQVALLAETVEVNGWESLRWKIKELRPDQLMESGYADVALELHKDERTAYRFNLNSKQPHLFVLCQEDELGEELTPVHITASQDDAASFMDGEHQLIELPMPAAVQCWIDVYLGVHGELIDEGKKKKKKGRGRSSGR